MIINIIQRPSLSNSYMFQKSVAEELGLKVTLAVRATDLNNEELVAMVRSDSEKYGSEIMLWINHKDYSSSWLMSRNEKKEHVRFSIDTFKKVFGKVPESVGHYVLDSDYIKILKEYCPDIKTVVAGCFEEGTNVFHGCNNSWYLFSEGMSWTTWYPSKTHSLRPAKNEDDWAGVVAVPHLCRDLVQAYEGRDDFFASHPANVQRGLGNEGMIHEYDFNLADQYRMQEDYNDFQSYYQIHVAASWLSGNFNIIDSDEITQGIYRETLEYMARLCDEGKAQSMTLGEYGSYYKNNVPIGGQTVGVGKDILYGSGKQYFWLTCVGYRVLVDTFQGGSIGDLRPYAGEYEAFTGIDSETPLMNSYPYVIQSQLRSGVKNHFEDGSRTTLFVSHGGETLDMCFYPTKIQEIRREKNKTELILTPVILEFKDGFRIKLQTVYIFADGMIEIKRRILEKTNGDCEAVEYVKGCYGFIEYPEEMRGIILGVDEQKMNYTYRKQEILTENGTCAYAEIPKIGTKLELCSDSAKAAGVKEGHLFNPYYTLTMKYSLNEKEEITTWLKLKKA